MNVDWKFRVQCADEGKLKNVAKEIHWEASIRVDDILVDRSGTVLLDDPDPKSFLKVPDQLNHDILKTWLSKKLVKQTESDLISAMEFRLEQRDAAKNTFHF